MSEQVPTKEEYIDAAIGCARGGLRCGVPHEQLFWYVRATYSTVLTDREIGFIRDLVLESTPQ